ncbi:MAG: heavy metal translocating P-type ATPase [Chloroflexota bacterium]
MSTKIATNVDAFRFKIGGMDCAGCARSVETAVSQLDGIANCELNFHTETLHLSSANSQDAVQNQVQKTVESLGFTLINPHEKIHGLAQQNAPSPQNFWAYLWQRLETRLALIAAILVIPGIVMTEILGQEQGWVNGLSLVAMGLAGWPIARSAWRSLRVSREININVLMTVAAIGAVIIGAYVEAALVMVLFAMGEALEGYTASRARNAIRSLMEVAPTTATLLSGNTQQQIHVEQLAIGDVILVRPGERVPMDGRVSTGESAINQAPITGESRLIEKAEGDELFAGSINGEGVLEVTVTRLVADNTISRMIRMVEEAQEGRAPTQRFIDQFAQRYTPAVMVLAILTAIIPPLLFGQPFLNPNPETFGWLYRGLAVLVVACPCALVISTPVSIISAISNAARHGVMVKGGVYLEKLSQIQAVAFDKTGTLTLGKPSVQGVRAANCANDAARWSDCMDCREVLALAGAVEARSEHPLAHAILAATDVHGLSAHYPPAKKVTALTGRGVQGMVADRHILIGSHTHFDTHIPHSEEQCGNAKTDATLGYTPMMVGEDNTYLGTITVADTIRENSRSVVAALKALGLRAVVMLTGDAIATAQKVGADIGVTDIRADLLPEEKVNAIQEIQQQYGAVAMVGDGINDAPALATADIGIAMGGASSTAQAMETADITLMGDDLRQLPFALKLSRMTMQRIRTNVFLSIGIKLAFLVLVVMGIGTMWMAVLADMGTSVLVTLNGMRLLREPNN